MLEKLSQLFNGRKRLLQTIGDMQGELAALRHTAAQLTEGKASVEQAHELATALTDADAANAAVAARLEETRAQLAAIEANARTDLTDLRKEMAAFAAAQDRTTALLTELTSRLETTQSAVLEVKDRLSYTRHRWDALDKLVDYLVVAHVPGDYFEFGVYEGRTFGYAVKILSGIFPRMRFIAFDSFQGLPAPKGPDAEDGYTGGFAEGQFACTEERFTEQMVKSGADMRRITTVPGWFHETLGDTHPVSGSLGKVAAAWIDCDLYESTPPVLDFLTGRLSVGSVLLFDDWRCFRNLAEFGEQRACAEWLARNPQIRLNDFFEFGFGGKAFTVAACA